MILNPDVWKEIKWANSIIESEWGQFVVVVYYNIDSINGSFWFDNHRFLCCCCYYSDSVVVKEILYSSKEKVSNRHYCCNCDCACCDSKPELVYPSSMVADAASCAVVGVVENHVVVVLVCAVFVVNVVVVPPCFLGCVMVSNGYTVVPIYIYIWISDEFSTTVS